MIDLAGCSDGELAALALGGRQTAYGELMRRHREAIFRLARSHTGDDDTALEVTQQSFISAFAALRSYDPQRPFRTWISRIAINKSRDLARRRMVRRAFAFALPLEDARDVADGHVLADAALADREELNHTMAAIATLPTRLKEVLLLRTIEGLSQSEAAEVLEISEKAAETRLYRARMKLQEILRA
ncbi:RNA polymerase sigma factor [Sphingopyxis sp. GW247-27LB]|uniref:RNA polymerase sigma factor n=1 Tax=Sphingopyxis sp. GW247-27LB TaxID=2012632 RepID=UPI000BA52A03|nr:RNA polymerase sigma factor [Sphingopyxis sp. GW247-27LB]PAL19779.1 RNA polymerase subunit sigma-24 [Sphingopyxis sp. GW247-27LB]